MALSHDSVILHNTRLSSNKIIPLRAKRAREVANLTERKNPHTPVPFEKKFAPLAARAVFVSLFFKNS